MEQDYCKDGFRYEETSLESFQDCFTRMPGGLVLLCTEGEAVILTDTQENRIKKNSDMIILPGTTVGVTFASNDFKAKAFFFSKAVYDEVSLPLGVSFSQYLKAVPFYTYPIGEENLLHNSHVWMKLAEMLCAEEQVEFKDVMQRNFLQNYLLYLYNFCKLYFEHTIQSYTPRQEIFFRFLGLLDIYCPEQRKVSFYADKLCVSSRYLSEITADCTHTETPKSMIDKRFVIKIKILLQTTNLSLEDLADALHFPSKSYLARFFKRHTGTTLTEYRKGMKVIYASSAFTKLQP